MRARSLFQALLLVGAILAIAGGATIGALHIAAPELRLLPRLEIGYHQIVFGFLFMTAFAVASALIELLAGARHSPRPDVVEPPPPLPPSTEPAKPASKLEARYHEMKTYIDLEMWELALEKATLILSDYPGTREADLVAKNINELRWKAEPKFVAKAEPISADQERQLREKGLAQMYQHVKTYIELEMWELARQKAVAIMKNFPESPESLELMKMFDTIEKKAKEAVAIGEPKG